MLVELCQAQDSDKNQELDSKYAVVVLQARIVLNKSMAACSEGLSTQISKIKSTDFHELKVTGPDVRLNQLELKHLSIFTPISLQYLNRRSYYVSPDISQPPTPFIIDNLC